MWSTVDVNNECSGFSGLQERSVWIYKHAFFRRDEPELLHALKRKTNQHGTPGRVGGAAGTEGGEDMIVAASPVMERCVLQ